MMNPVAIDASSPPAVLGGQPVFATKVPIVRPALPGFDQLQAGLRQVLDTGMVTKGANLQALEQAMAGHLQVEHAVAVSSCTSGLMLVYRGLGLTGDVVVPSFTFMATVSALVWAGLRPVFADVDGASFNLDSQAAEAAITPQTSAIVAVHNFGNPTDIAGLEALARRRGLKLVFDAAHGFGSLYQGQPVGGQGDAQVFSLSPTKLVIAGEGGIVATNDAGLAAFVRRGREYGMGDGYDSLFAGLNSRMSEFNALLGLNSLPLLEQHVRRRQQIAELFRRELGGLPGIGFQEIRPANRSSLKDFSITVEAEAFGLSRDVLAGCMAAENIDCRKYYDPPAHRQTAYRHWAPPEGTLSNTERLAATSLSLPIWSHMDDATAEGICRAVRRIHRSADEIARRA
jgi:dTDP-4-amino-4,6-dideoxygalactose transaminase